MLTLALGIGANTAIFTVINAVMLRALPVQHPEQLVAIGNPALVHSWGTGTPRTDVFSYPLYREVRDKIACFRLCSQARNWKICGSPLSASAENINGRLVTENYFQTLGVGALLGRTFTVEDDRIARRLTPYWSLAMDIGTDDSPAILLLSEVKFA